MRYNYVSNNDSGEVTDVTDKPQPKGAGEHSPVPASNKNEKQKRWSFTPGVFVLVIGVAAILGYGAGTRNDQILATVAPALGFKVEKSTLDMSSVQTTFQQLKSNFDGTLDENALIQGASKGLVAAAGDPHTEFFTQKEAEKFKDDLSGDIGGGIGAEIGMREEKPTVIRTLKDTPAEKSGLASGDVLLAVNDEAVGKQTVDKIVQKIRGDVGSTVKIAVSRDDEKKEFTITREEITSPSVDSRIEADTGIIKISRFDEKTGESARAAAQEFMNKGVKKVVLDLRDNGGGYLTAAPEVAGLWIEDKVIVSERLKGKSTDEQRSGSNAILAGMPTVILVNGGTASASEIVTAAMKEYNVATIIGEKTYGKGTVQTMVELDGGALLKVTIQRWFTPMGKNVDGKGITPDKVVELKRADVDAERDPQLDAAKAWLAK